MDPLQSEAAEEDAPDSGDQLLPLLNLRSHDVAAQLRVLPLGGGGVGSPLAGPSSPSSPGAAAEEGVWPAPWARPRALRAAAKLACVAAVLVLAAAGLSPRAAGPPQRDGRAGRHALARFVELDEATPAPAQALTSATSVTASPKAYAGAAAAFRALDTDGDGVVQVNGVPQNLAQFEQASRLEQQQRIAAKGPDYNNLATDMSSARQAAANQAAVWSNSATSSQSLQPRLEPKHKSHAIAKELYTFGAPATTETGVFDAQTPGGCFSGLRVTDQAHYLMVGTGTLQLKSDPVSSILDFVYRHALMDWVGASTADDKHMRTVNCSFFKTHLSRLKDTPRWDNMWWLNGHMEYPSNVRAHADTLPIVASSMGSPDDLPPLSRRRLQDVNGEKGNNLSMADKVERASLMANFAFVNYEDSQQIGIDVRHLGWTMVGRANGATDEGGAPGLLGLGTSVTTKGSNAGRLAQTVDTFSDGFGDRLLLLQHKTTLECAIVFEGSGLDDIKDWLSNLDFAPTSFCGFGHTHSGFRAKLYRMVGGIDYRQSIHRKVKSCSAVTVVGHSLGGAQAELFAACLNRNLKSGQEGFMDHRLIQLPKGEPQQLTAWFSDHAPGSFLRNRANKLCMDVRGTTMTTYRKPVIMYHCETPDSPYSKDQRWEFTPSGFIVSRLSGKCVDGNVTGTAVEQWPCQYNSNTTHQRWERTPEGFIRNKASGKCLNSTMQLYPCPFTDQKWELKSSGHVVNRLSGKCLDVSGAPGTADGAELVLWPCDMTGETDQLWDLLDNGRLRNRLSGKCVVSKVKVHVESTPSVVLGPCESAVSWHFAASGFVTDTFTAKCLNVEGAPGEESGSKINVDTCEEKSIDTSGKWLVDAGGFIINVGNVFSHRAQCMEIFALPWHEEQKKADGARLWLDYCEVNTDQKWELTSSGYLRNVIGGQKCLGQIHKTGSLNPQDPEFWIDNCIDPSDPALYMEMKWSMSASGQGGGHLVNRFSRKCMAWVFGSQVGSPAGGNVNIVPWACDQPNGNPLWDFSNGSIVSLTNRQCLEAGPAGVEGEQALTIGACTSAASQKWELTSHGFLRNKQTSLCAGTFTDMADLGRMEVMLKPCPTGAAQQWELLPSGQIRNKGSGKCLSAPQKSQNLEFFQLTEWDCDPADTSQQWDRIAAPMLIAD